MVASAKFGSRWECQSCYLFFLILTLLIDGSYKYRCKKQPKYIAIEDLNVKRMMKNKYLARDIANCSFFTLSKKNI